MISFPFYPWYGMLLFKYYKLKKLEELQLTEEKL